MRQTSKILAVLVLICAMLYGCSKLNTMKEDQILTFQDLTITLPGYFDNLINTEYDSTGTFMYGISEITVTGIREAYMLFEEVPELEEYGNLLIDKNSLNSQLEQTDGITTFTFTIADGETSYTYLAGIYAGSEAFWLVQAGCRTQNFEESREAFLEYLQTVVVT